MTAAVPKTVGVIGGGRMGAGIAQVLAVAGAVVCLAERDTAARGELGRKTGQGFFTWEAS